MYFVVIVLLVYNDCGSVFVGLCDHCVILPHHCVILPDA